MTNLAWNVERVLPSAIADLHRLISIPSISSKSSTLLTVADSAVI